MITVNRPDLDKEDVVAFINGHFKECIPSLEKEFSSYTNMKYNIFTSSCRSALYLAYTSLKLEGEVIVSPLTCSIAILPIICCNLKPHFVDIDPYTYNIDPEEINEAITNNTCAIQVIHLAGNPCDMGAIKELAEDHNLILIEDCAQSLGAEYQGDNVGSLGDVSCFSFMKNLYGTGGGIIATNNQNLALKIRASQQSFRSFPKSLRYYRFTRNLIESRRGTFFDLLYSSLFHFRNKAISDDREGCSFLMSGLHNPSNVEASTCATQIKKLESLSEKRLTNASLLTKELKKECNVKTQRITKNSKHVFTKYMIETKHDCTEVIRKLQGKGIDAKHLEYKHGSLYQERFDSNPLYSEFESIKNCDNYLEIHDHIVSLPLSSNMTKDEILIIVKEVGDIIENK